MALQIPWLQKLLLKLIPEDNSRGCGVGPFDQGEADPFDAQCKGHDEAFALRESAIKADRAFFSAMMLKVSEVSKTSLNSAFLLLLRALLYITLCRTVGTVLRWRLPPL